MDEWNRDTRTLFEWACLAWFSSQKKVSIHLSLSPSCLTINFIEPRLFANNHHHHHHHPPMTVTAHHHNGHECPPMDGNECPPSTTWMTTGDAHQMTTWQQSRTTCSGHIAKLMQHQTRLRQEQGGSTWQEVGGDGCRGWLLLCCRSWAQVNKKPSPHHSLLWQMTITDVHCWQQTTTTRDKGQAQSKDHDNRWPWPWPQTTTYHHNARATATNNNAPPTVTTTHNKDDEQRWCTTENGDHDQLRQHIH